MSNDINNDDFLYRKRPGRRMSFGYGFSLALNMVTGVYLFSLLNGHPLEKGAVAGYEKTAVADHKKYLKENSKVVTDTTAYKQIMENGDTITGYEIDTVGYLVQKNDLKP